MSLNPEATRVRSAGEHEFTSEYDLEPKPPADLDSHGIQDYQSLLLHCAAVKLLQQEVELADRVLATLASWRTTTDPRSHALLDEWQDILDHRDWRRAVARDAQATQLRQASPLPTVLPPEMREKVLATVQALRDERWKVENKNALESSNQYVQERGLPIPATVPPELLVEPRLFADLNAVLRDGETVQEFIESAVRRAIELRRKPG